MKIAVIGAGNGGQAMAGYLSMKGYEVSLYDRDKKKVRELLKRGSIQLEGKIQGVGKVAHITNILPDAIKRAKIVMIVTIANAHIDIAHAMATYIEDGQVILLNPGRTCGALVFKQALKESKCKVRYYLGETQTLVYACRVVENGKVNIIGIKDEVLLSGLPSCDTNYILEQVRTFYPCFKACENVLHTSFENIGAMFHPCVCLFNAATIERQRQFYFYRDMTKQVANFIEKFDAERLSVGRAYGIKLLSVNEWIKVAYKDTKGDTLCECMQNNPGYYDIKGPGTIFTRQLTEDIPTGVLPIRDLGKVAGVATPLLDSMIIIIEALLDMDLHTNGRSLKNLGLEYKTHEEILEFIKNGE